MFVQSEKVIAKWSGIPGVSKIKLGSDENIKSEVFIISPQVGSFMRLLSFAVSTNR